jgi:hypothetical protein
VTALLLAGGAQPQVAAPCPQTVRTRAAKREHDFTRRCPKISTFSTSPAFAHRCTAKPNPQPPVSSGVRLQLDRRASPARILLATMSANVAFQLRCAPVAVVCLLVTGCGERSPGSLSGRSAPPPSVIAGVTWPPLPTHGFVSGRPATKEDVAAGRAAVSAYSEGHVAATPISNAVPQYAFHVDEAGKRTPGIIIQAEQAGSLRIIGFKPLSGNELMAATEKEFEFLGTGLARPGLRQSQ